MANQQQINPQNLPEIVWQDHKVITTDLLAQCYEADVKYIQQNFSRNEKRFIEGKHFFKLEGDALRSFKSQSNNGEPSERGSVKIAVNINSLMLWTERGAARHAKILDNDKAWDVFDRMEEVYFHPERKPESEPLVANDKQQIIALQTQVNDLLCFKVDVLSKQIKPAPRKALPDEIVTIMGLYQQGYRMRAIAEKVGRTRDSVRHIVANNKGAK